MVYYVLVFAGSGGVVGMRTFFWTRLLRLFGHSNQQSE